MQQTSGDPWDKGHMLRMTEQKKKKQKNRRNNLGPRWHL